MSLDRLATIEHALTRKRASMQALGQRVHSRPTPAAARPPPNSDAARLAIIQREVASLERSREEELLALASSDTRHARTGSPSAPATAGTSAQDAAAVAHEAAEAKDAWLEYRAAQQQRQAALGESLRSSWRARTDEVAHLRKMASPRVDTRFVGAPQARGASARPRSAAASQRSSSARRPKSPAAHNDAKDADVVAARSAARVLNRELMSQRTREWAARSEHLRAMRVHTAKRVDDRIGEEAMRARPLYGFTEVPVASGSPPRERTPIIDDAELFCGTYPELQPPPVPRPAPPPGAWSMVADDFGEYEVGFTGTLCTDPLYAYDEGDRLVAYRHPQRQGARPIAPPPPDDPFRYGYTAEAAEKRRRSSSSARGGDRSRGAEQAAARSGSAHVRTRSYEAMRRMLRS